MKTNKKRLIEVNYSLAEIREAITKHNTLSTEDFSGYLTSRFIKLSDEKLSLENEIYTERKKNYMNKKENTKNGTN